MFRSWFGAPLDVAGFQYYGVVDDNAVVAVGMLYVSDGCAWSSDSATLPSHQGRGYHRALQLHRLQESLAQGVQLAHTENVIDAPTFDSGSYHNNRKLGFVHLYDNPLDISVDPTTAEVTLVVSDVMMPELTGVESARTLGQRYPDLAIVLVSGTADARGLDGLGPTVSLLSKPFRPSALVDAVHQLLAQRAARP